MIDFSGEEDQREANYGPVPAGSIVIVKMEVMEPFADRQARDDRYVSVAKSGLRQLYCKFVVDRGQYAGVEWRQNITLPEGVQNIRLSESQGKACRIGGAVLKAILQASGRRNLQIASYEDFTGLKFPVRVRINAQPYESQNGKTYWRNEIARVIIPDMPEYEEIKREGEMITNGPVSGEAKVDAAYGGSQPGEPARDPFDDDAVPF